MGSFQSVNLYFISPIFQSLSLEIDCLIFDDLSLLWAFINLKFSLSKRASLDLAKLFCFEWDTIALIFLCLVFGNKSLFIL